MYVDVHNHFLPEPYVETLLEWDTAVGQEVVMHIDVHVSPNGAVFV